MKNILLVLPMLLTAPVLSHAQTGMDPERLALIPTRLQEFVDDGQIVGAVMVLARHDGIVLLEAVGYQDLETKTPMRADAIFTMKSVTKPMTALGIMVLQEDGRLSTSDRLGQYLPNLGNLQTAEAGDRFPPVRLGQLMTHTSGMASEGDLYEQDFMRKSLADVVATYVSKPLASAPGTRFIYSTPGFDILGRVIEVVSGTSYEAFFEERVFDPLGMQDSGFFVPPEHRGRMPSFYRIEDGRLHEGAGPNSQSGDLPHEGRVFPAPGFGLYSTAPDLGALLQMMLSGGTYQGRRILSRASVTAMSVDQIRNVEIGPNGFGWQVQTRLFNHGGPLASSRAWGHRGASGVSVWVDPENDLAGAWLIHQIGPEAVSARSAFENMAFAAVVDR